MSAAALADDDLCEIALVEWMLARCVPPEAKTALDEYEPRYSPDLDYDPAPGKPRRR